MGDEKVLSSEEVEALLQASKPSGDQALATSADDESNFNEKDFANIIDSTQAETSKTLTALLRKKIIVKSKPPQQLTNNDFIETQKEGKLLSTYTIAPFESTVLTSVDFNHIYQTINMLYGGKLEPETKPTSSSGKIGSIVGEKLSSILVDSLMSACVEHAETSYEHTKTSTSVMRINNLPENEKIHVVEYLVFFDDIELPIFISFPEEMLIKLVPLKMKSAKHMEKDFWRDAIKSEVMDSIVNVSVTLKDIRTSLTDFSTLKNGGEIKIDDPTSVFICLNNYKLFHAVAGESNDQLVAKVIKQI